jgi:N-acylneuraminate cytidylyltransferase
MNVAVIPARGGSKRIPRKNIRLFAGKPVIAYSIEAAAACGLFDRIVVSTDDEEIASVARASGAEVPFMRPAELSDDFTGTTEVIGHAVKWLSEHGPRVTYACCIYATAPFVQPDLLRRGYEELVAAKKSFAFSVTSFPFPVQRAIRITKAGGVEPLYPEFIESRSQDLEPAYHDAGQFYWGRAEAFLSSAPIFSHASVPIVVPRYLVQDIDTLEDWRRAELMYRAWRESDGATAK